jgi:hypothetical protein
VVTSAPEGGIVVSIQERNGIIYPVVDPKIIS